MSPVEEVARVEEYATYLGLTDADLATIMGIREDRIAQLRVNSSEINSPEATAYSTAANVMESQVRAIVEARAVAELEKITP